MNKKLIALLLIPSILISSNAHAFAPNPDKLKFITNKAVLEKLRMMNKGTPVQIAGTISASSVVASTVASTAIAAGCTAAFWACAVASVAVGTAVEMGVQKGLTMYFNGPNSVDITVTNDFSTYKIPAGTQPIADTTSMPYVWSCTVYIGSGPSTTWQTMYASSAETCGAIAMQSIAASSIGYSIVSSQKSCSMMGTDLYQCLVNNQRPNGTEYESSFNVYRSPNNPSYVCSTGAYLSQDGCLGNTSKSYTGKTLKQATDLVPDSVMNKDLSPDVIAKLTNKIWQSSSSATGYTGIPYDPTNPVTAEEIQTIIDKNPELKPTIRDLLQSSPLINPTTGQPQAPTADWPIYDPNTGNLDQPIDSTSYHNDDPTAPVQKVDLGSDPMIGQPNLEQTPTIAQILDPLLNLFPNLKNYVVPNHTSICPTPSFDAMGHHYVMDTQCTIIEENRGFFDAIFLVFWSVLAVLIVLGA